MEFAKYKKKLIIFLIVIIILLILKYVGFFSLISKYCDIDCFKQNREYLLDQVNKHYVRSVILYIFLLIVTIISTLPLVSFFAVVGGFLFSPIFGTVYAVIGSVAGSTISFLIFRYILGNIIQKKYGAKLSGFNKNIEHYGASYLLVVNLAGAIPFFIINSLASLTTMPLKTFVWATTVGIIPATFVYAYAGRQLGNINSMKEILSPNIILAFFLLALLSLSAIFIKMYREKHKKN